MTTAKPEPLSPLRSVQGSGLLMIVSEFSDSTKLDISIIMIYIIQCLICDHINSQRGQQ